MVTSTLRENSSRFHIESTRVKEDLWSYLSDDEMKRMKFGLIREKGLEVFQACLAGRKTWARPCWSYYLVWEWLHQYEAKKLCWEGDIWNTLVNLLLQHKINREWMICVLYPIVFYFVILICVRGKLKAAAAFSKDQEYWWTINFQKEKFHFFLCKITQPFV